MDFIPIGDFDYRCRQQYVLRWSRASGRGRQALGRVGVVARLCFRVLCCSVSPRSRGRSRMQQGVVLCLTHLACAARASLGAMSRSKAIEAHTELFHLFTTAIYRQFPEALAPWQ